MSSEPYFTATSVLGGNTVELGEDPLRPGELMLTAEAGVRVRVRLDEEGTHRLAAALHRWYARPEHRVATDEEVAADIITEFRDGVAYSFTAPPEV